MDESPFPNQLCCRKTIASPPLKEVLQWHFTPLFSGASIYFEESCSHYYFFCFILSSFHLSPSFSFFVSISIFNGFTQRIFFPLTKKKKENRKPKPRRPVGGVINRQRLEYTLQATAFSPFFSFSPFATGSIKLRQQASNCCVAQNTAKTWLILI